MRELNRRDFVCSSVLATACMGALGHRSLFAQDAFETFRRDWRLRYAPRLDWGPGSLIERVERVAEYGFTGVEFNWLARREMSEIEALRKHIHW